MKKYLLLFLAPLFSPVVQHSSFAVERPSASNDLRDWTSYLGANYGEPEWAGAIRGAGRRESSDAAVEVNAKSLAALVAEVRSIAAKRTVIVPMGGFSREEGSLAKFLDGVKRDGGRAWAESVRARVAALLQTPEADRITFQFGNEINAKRISGSLHAWLKDGVKPSYGDAAVMEHYAEFYLAPSLAGVRLAEQDTGRKATIVLGSLANAHNDANLRWLDSLLEHRFDGRVLAPELAGMIKGQRVADAVNIVTLHYLLTSPAQDWQSRLAGVFDQWLGKGAITGIWETEEMGKSNANAGLGAATALRVSARFLHFTGARSLQPAQARAFFWGWNLGPEATRGDVGMKALAEVLGHGAVREVASVKTMPAKGFESYGFTTAEGARAMIIFPSETKSGADEEEGFSSARTERALARIETSAPAKDSALHLTATLFTREGAHPLAKNTPLVMDAKGAVALPDGFSMKAGECLLIAVKPAARH